MTSKLKSSRGITLVELMATVVIIGIIAAIATPHFQKAIERIRFRSQTKNLVSMLRTARSHAISEKKPYGVAFDFSANTVSLFLDSANLGANTYEPGADSLIAVDTLPPEFMSCYSTFAGSAVVFQPNGSASSTGDINLRAATESEISESQINVLASTGRSKITYICNMGGYEQVN
ncbi:MAG: GspH/FimT family pseudopilin [Candidatus Zixiibacteriota bacterium]|nr:MAG: GspH/FimT family pseudopilin [candidate division Zixibacteria bacterium]